MKPTPVGPPLDLRFTLLPLNPGLQKVVTLSCPGGESLVDGWNATAFTTPAPPASGLASAVRVQMSIVGGRARMAVSASETLPAAAGAEVQLGVRCAA